MKILRNALIFMVLLIIAVGCTDYVPQDRRLTAIEELSVSDGPLALDSLLMIDASSLSEADMHYYDFLRVKVADKAYVRHTSDSLILTVIDYERHHKATGRYPEALYYGGRVYSDLGDKPTALSHFQEAL